MTQYTFEVAIYALTFAAVGIGLDMLVHKLRRKYMRRPQMRLNYHVGESTNHERDTPVYAGR